MSRVQIQNGKQYMITIPNMIVRLMNIKKGENYDFKINRKGNMELIKTGG